MGCDHNHDGAIVLECEIHCMVDDRSKPVESKPDHYVIELAAQCSRCGERFHFLGPETGHRFDRPTVNVDATRIAIPMAPGAAPALPKRLTFQIPGRRKA